MKAKAGIANALIYTNNNRAKYNIDIKTSKLAMYSTCGGKGDIHHRMRPDSQHNTESLTIGSRPTPPMGCGLNPSPVTTPMGCTGADISHIINNKARKIILEQGYCTDIYNKKGILIYIITTILI